MAATLLARSAAAEAPRPPAGSEEAAKQRAREMVSQANEAYAQGHFAEAGQLYISAHDMAEDAHLGSKPELLFNAGLAYERVGECEQVVRLFTRYARELPSADTQELRDRITKARGCAPDFVVVTDPPSALVSVDGQVVGTTPLNANIRAGAHQLRISHFSHKTLEEALIVEPGKPVAIQRKLEPELRMGQIVLNAVAAGNVFIDNRLIGHGPFRVPLDLAAGPHQVRIEDRGCQTQKLDIEVQTGGAALPVVADLACGPEVDVLFDLPREAKVSVDGVSMSGPWGRNFLRAGKHLVKVEVPGCGTSETDMTIPNGGPLVRIPPPPACAVAEAPPPSSFPWKWTALGVGAAGVATGVVLAILAGNASGSHGGLTAGSIAGFGVGAAGLVTFGVLALSGSSDAPAPASSEAPAIAVAP